MGLSPSTVSRLSKERAGQALGAWARSFSIVRGPGLGLFPAPTAVRRGGWSPEGLPCTGVSASQGHYCCGHGLTCFTLCPIIPRTKQCSLPHTWKKKKSEESSSCCTSPWLVTLFQLSCNLQSSRTCCPHLILLQTDAWAGLPWALSPLTCLEASSPSAFLVPQLRPPSH